MDKDNIIYLTKRAINNNGRFRVDEDYMELDSNDIDHIAEEIAETMSREFEQQEKENKRLRTLLNNAIVCLEDQYGGYESWSEDELLEELGMTKEEYNEIMEEFE